MKGYHHCRTEKERKERRRQVLRRYELSSKGRDNRLRYRRALRLRLVEFLGGVCRHCGSTSDLQFAHVKPTPIVYSQVGQRKERDSSITSKARDIRQYPKHYLLLCAICHEQYDRKRNGYKGQAGAFRNQ